MKNYILDIILRVQLMGSYWHSPGPNVEPKGHHWVHLWDFSNLVKAMGIGVYFWTLIVSV